MQLWEPLSILLLAVSWIGHSAFWMALLNHVYARPVPKWFLKNWRLFTWFLMAIYPLAWWQCFDQTAFMVYVGFCSVIFCGFCVITWERNFRKQPKAVLTEKTTTFDPWQTQGNAIIGHGAWHWVPRVPLNCALKFDLTEMTLAVPKLPKEWEGMSVLLISDFHFHGTPAKAWYDAILDEIEKLGTPDVVVLAGDFLDSDEHFHWIREIIGRLKWNDQALAILGNHDVKFSPDEIRNELTNLGYTVVSNRWQTVTIRGVPAVVVGHEGPWFQPGPELTDAPKDLFRICVSHTPDYFYWARERGVNLMFCGHVHGGQVRLPILGSIFVPSWYSRRFDMGVFESGDMVMVVSRGLSGKEPLRFRCNPQVIRMKLVSGSNS